MLVALRTLVVVSLLSASACSVRPSGDGAGADSALTDAGGNPTSQLSPLESRQYPEQPLSCELSEMRRWVDANMRDYYLFYDQVPDLQLNQYDSLSSLVTDLRVTPNDQFSYITDAARADAEFNNGIKFGFGQLMAVTSNNEVRVTQVYPRSPFANAGIERGDYLEKLNGVAIFDAPEEDILALFGVSTDPVTMDFTIRSSTGNIRDVTMTSTDFAFSTVLHRSEINMDGKTIGYLMFDSFLDTSRDELYDAFDAFDAAGIDELILDLRYNRGGRVDIAALLASLILGQDGNNQTFTTFALNRKYSDLNQTLTFPTSATEGSLSRVVVLTTEDSCSASELVINGLEPFLDVVVIGAATCGKPYGSIGRDACDKQMNALEFEFVNANGVGGYYQGIAADCLVEDDLQNALGNQSEGLLNAGLAYLQEGTCRSTATRQKSEPVRSWRPYDPATSQLGNTTRN